MDYRTPLIVILIVKYKQHLAKDGLVCLARKKKEENKRGAM